MTRPPVRRAWVTVAVLAVLAGLLGTTVSVGAARFGAGLVHLLTGWTIAASGLVAWHRQPSSRVGPLLAIGGAAFFIGDVVPCLDLYPISRACLRVPGAAAVASALAFLWTGFMGHALVVFPRGEIRDRGMGLLVVAVHATSLAAPVWRAELGPTLLIAGLAVILTVGQWRSPSRVRQERQPAILGAWGATLVVAAAAGLTVLRQQPDWEPLLGSLRTVTPPVALSVAGALVALWLAAWMAAEDHDGLLTTDRVVELGDSPGGPAQESLAAALGDPSLRVGTWDSDGGVWRDSLGAVLSPPAPDDPARQAIRLERDGRPIAILVHDAAVARDPRLRVALERAVELNRANEALTVQVRTQLAEVEASRRRLVDAGIEERRELERRLHLGAQQHLGELAVVLDTAIARTADPAHRPSPAGDPQDRLRHINDQVAETRREVTELATGLHPRSLERLGLAGALAELCARSPVPATLDVPAGIEPARPAQVTTWFLVSEALANIAKHARATVVSVEVEVDRVGNLRTTVVDDGIGGATVRRGGGLEGLAERLDALGGRLTIESPPGNGTRLSAMIPVPTA